MEIGLILVITTGVVVSVMYLVGQFIPVQHVASRMITINASLEEVWQAVTDIENQMAWRRDLKKVEILGKWQQGLIWIEHRRKGQTIKFREKEKIVPSRYEIEVVAGDQLAGYWIGEFRKENGVVNLESTEVGEIHNPIMRTLAALFFDLGKTIDRYQSNLKNYVEEKRNNGGFS